MASPSIKFNPALEPAISRMLKGLKASDPIEKQAKILELAMKYEALKLKQKGPSYGKGFDEDDEGGDNEGEDF